MGENGISINHLGAPGFYDTFKFKSKRRAYFRKMVIKNNVFLLIFIFLIILCSVQNNKEYEKINGGRFHIMSLSILVL